MGIPGIPVVNQNWGWITELTTSGYCQKTCWAHTLECLRDRKSLQHSIVSLIQRIDFWDNLQETSGNYVLLPPFLYEFTHFLA